MISRADAMPMTPSSRAAGTATAAPRAVGDRPWYQPESLRRLARRQLAWAHVPPEALDDVQLRDTGAAEVLMPLLRADARDGASRLWGAVAAEAAAGRTALLAAARWCGDQEERGDAVVTIAEVVAESLVLPLRWRGGQRARVELLRARDGLVALQTPTAVHRELLAACIGPADGDLDEAVRRWAGARLAAAAEEELQQCSLPALAVGEPTRRGIAALPAPAATRRGLGLPRRAAHGAGNRGPLRGLRVIELGGLWAAPLATRLLGDLGAVVIKVEMPQRPDGLRRGSPAHFAALNRGKRRLALDLRLSRDRDRLLALLGPGTLIVENHSPRVLPNLGMPAERLAAAGTAVVSLPPRRGRRNEAPPQRVALGPTIELAAGLGLRDPVTGALACAPLPFTDALTGIRAALAGLAALRSAATMLRLAQVEDVAAPLARHLRTGQL
jgi:hypothetical protein